MLKRNIFWHLVSNHYLGRIILKDASSITPEFVLSLSVHFTLFSKQFIENVVITEFSRLRELRGGSSPKLKEGQPAVGAPKVLQEKARRRPAKVFVSPI